MSNKTETEAVAAIEPKDNGPSSLFTSSVDELSVGERKITLRHLRMVNCSLLFVVDSAVERVDEMGVAMPSSDNTKVLQTTLFGPHFVTDSTKFAENLSKVFGRQIFVSYNVQIDKVDNLLLQQQLGDYIRRHKAEFS